MNTSLLEQELAPLNAQIEQVRGALAELGSEMRAAEAELETFSADRLRYDALREACRLLERLDELEAGQLFWEDLPEVKDPSSHIERLRSRIGVFDGHIKRIIEKHEELKGRHEQHLDELDDLHDQVRSAHIQDQRRESEFAIVRELVPVFHRAIMPWNHDAESERRYRRTLSISLLLSLLLTIIVQIVTVPKPVRPAVVQIPERLAMMVRKEHKKPEPVKKHKEEKKEAKKEEKSAEKKEEKTQTAKAQEKPTPQRPKPSASAASAAPEPAPKKSQNTGMLAFKDSFKDLIDETPVAKLGAEARLSNPATHAVGQAQASRSLVSIQGGGGSSGGIGNAAVSRNLGSGGIGGAGVSRSAGSGSGKGNDGRIGRDGNGFAHVKSGIGGQGGKEAGRPLSSSARPARTEEEIQLLFDRYKAALYRIYNTELRKDPTLRGKMVIKLTIEPGGAVSACGVESTNMNAPEFCDQIVDRVKKFNFGPKEGVPKTTILYPIDFLPGR